MKLPLFLLFIAFSFAFTCDAQPVIYINQIGFNTNAPKMAVIRVDKKLSSNIKFSLVNTVSGKTDYIGILSSAQTINEWTPGKTYYRADFSGYKNAGKYNLRIVADGKSYLSYPFEIGDDLLAKRTISSIIHYYNKQRANTPAELAADEHMHLVGGGDKTVDVRGGWCDASGDVSKYFSHLAYANFMSPQQTPLVVWSMVSASEALSDKLEKWKLKDSLDTEALYGADYMMKALSKDDYFYMVVFSFFNKDPNARRIVGLHADSKVTDEYQCAFREGGGMAIAALARISQWNRDRAYSSGQYLDAAKRAFAHLLVYNTKYDDDGKENIIDDYCALMAATELWIATDEPLYRDEARKRANNLNKRMTTAGYFIANDSNRPYWHASDAGLPVVALSRYLDIEKDVAHRAEALLTIKKALTYNLTVTNEVSNPFGYARQTFLYKGAVKNGFFIPHDNETGWWWQGEDARLGSLTTAALVGGKLAYPRKENILTRTKLAGYAGQQVSWILGCNPYSMCFMYGFGEKNVPYMHSNFGHGSERGGVSNGITGKEGHSDGSGIDFKTEDKGDEWRWTEQWIPHAAWFLQAVVAMEKE
jgi:hypothetical protein